MQIMIRSSGILIIEEKSTKEKIICICIHRRAIKEKCKDIKRKRNNGNSIISDLNNINNMKFLYGAINTLITYSKSNNYKLIIAGDWNINFKNIAGIKQICNNVYNYDIISYDYKLSYLELKKYLNKIVFYNKNHKISIFTENIKKIDHIITNFTPGINYEIMNVDKLFNDNDHYPLMIKQKTT